MAQPEPNPNERLAVLIDQVNYHFTLPILMDNKTEQYVKMSKIMLFIRASDNSFRACINKLQDKYKQNCYVCKADCFADQGRNFEIEGGDGNDLIRTCCRERIKRICLNGKNLVVIDTSKFSTQDIKYFSALAQQMRYVTVVEPWRSGRTFQTNGSRFKNDIYVEHAFFGWFLNVKDSCILREEVLLYIKDCIGEIQKFASMLRKCNAINDVENYYGLEMPIQVHDIVYCITKYCRSNYLLAHNYLSALASENAYGRVTHLLVYAFIVSPKVVGVKIKLKYKQRNIKQVDLTKVQLPAANVVLQNAPLTREEINMSPSSVSKSTLESIPSQHHDPSQAIWGHSHSAVMTLGHCASIDRQQALLALSDAVNREVYASQDPHKDDDLITMKRAVVRPYGQYWIIYLKDLLSVDAMMASEIVVK